MFFEFLRFELRYWFRGLMVYIFFAIIATMFFAAAVSDQIVVGQALGNTFRNAPYVIQMYYAVGGVLAGLMVTAFVDSAASRDFVCKSNEILFSKPIGKRSFLAGRFVGCMIAALFPLLGVSAGILIAGFYPWNDPVRWGPINWQAHLASLLTFAIPNTLLFGSVVFAISVWTRSTLYSFIGTLLFLVAYTIAGSYLEEMENETLGAMLDPLGFGAFSVMTKYWTVEEKNTLSIGLHGLMLANRAIWMSFVAALVGIAYWRFDFSERHKPSSKKADSTSPLAKPQVAYGAQTITPASEWAIARAQLFSHIKSDFKGVIRSTVFLVLLACGLLNMIPVVWFNATESFGLSTFPVTYHQVDMVRASLVSFLIAIIAFFGGVLVWRDRDFRFHEILGALPHRNWAPYVSRLFSIVLILASLLSLGIATGVASQLASSYDRLQWDVYFKELLVLDLLRMTFLSVLALLVHSLAPNKYIGYFLFILFVILNAFLWGALRVDTLLVKFGRMPGYTYSDFYQFEPYSPGLIGFGLYWSLFCLILGWITIQAMHRGVASPFLQRLQNGIRSSSLPSKLLLGLFVLCFASLGGWLYYNTLVLNQIVGPKTREERQVTYEEKWKKIESEPQPLIQEVKYDIAIYPETRNLTMKGTQRIENKSGVPIETLYVNVESVTEYDTTLDIEGASEATRDDDLAFRTLRFTPPMQPGESRNMAFEVRSKTRGIENSLSNTSIMQNGTFFNNSIAPTIGYDPNRELGDANKRRNRKLPKTDFPALTEEKGEPCMHHYIGNDSSWVNVETTISTSSDQIAVAPGTLIKSWKDADRSFFQYKVDHPSLNFYSFISARYVVEREKWNDVDLEVYYLPEHKWNVDKMMKSMRKSLEYCSANFGPYRHKQARIIEFPRVASYAQAFPGTMPYSESIGFIANLTDPDDIDMVFYVVAHEMAHQWWAHQVIGAKMQGATLLSETMAQYSALMVMEREYGRDMMRKFLRYEMDRYLKSRGAEQREERPLLRVTPDQGYIHYNKGSIVLYYLKEMVGEERLNAAFKSLIDDYGYKNPPYPNSYDLVKAVKKHMPEELHYLIVDLFEDITLFANKTVEASYTKQGDKFLVSLDIECKKLKANDKGVETEVPISDWIEIGAFAKPEVSKKFGDVLHRERVFITTAKSHHEFLIDKIPEKVGVDPFFLLVDRMPEDNLKRVEAR